MASVSISINFDRNTEEAFNFYKSVFGGEFEGGKLNRLGELPANEGMPPVAETDKNLIVHASLPIIGGVRLMGTDMPALMGTIERGNNMYISLHPDTRLECDRLFAALSAGGMVEMQMHEAFWGDYYGTCVDKFGTRWMFDTESKA